MDSKEQEVNMKQNTFSTFILIVICSSAAFAGIITSTDIYTVNLSTAATLTGASEEASREILKFDDSLGTLTSVNIKSDFNFTAGAIAEYLYGDSIGGGAIGSWSWSAIAGFAFNAPGFAFSQSFTLTSPGENINESGPGVAQPLFNQTFTNQTTIDNPSDLEDYLGPGTITTLSSVGIGTNDLFPSRNAAGFFFLPTNMVIEGAFMQSLGTNTITVEYNYVPIPEYSGIINFVLFLTFLISFIMNRKII